MRGKFAALIGTVVIVTSIGPARTLVARADDPNTCRSGYVCEWGESQYRGCRYDTASDQRYYSSQRYQYYGCHVYSINNGINSFTNRGTRCNIRFYSGENFTGNYMTFVHPGVPGQYQDPDLGNNGSGWNDRISSHNFCP